jgi:hemolysin III
MPFLLIREPVNTWTHFGAMLAAIPAAAFLLRLCRGDRVKFYGMLIYSVSLILCFACSALFHSVPAEVSEDFVLYDHFAIFILIAGTVTPIGMIVLNGWWRLGLLTVIWALAAIGITLRACFDTDLAVRTALYLGMGWVGCTMYFKLVRRLSHAKVAPMWLGGVFYSIGAAINVTWTRFPPEISSILFGPHEVFHVMVIAGSACHYYFMIAVLVPYRRLPAFLDDAVAPAHSAVSTLTNSGVRSSSAVNAETRG